MTKQKKLFTVLASLFVIFSIGTTAVIADDDDDGKREYFQSYDEDDEEDSEMEDHGDDFEGWENQVQSPVTQAQSQEFWNIWTREPRTNANNVLPVDTPSEMAVNNGNQESRLYVIPQNGQLLISAKAFSDTVGAEAVFYPKSRICILTKGDKELIVRAGSNAIYENQLKTPMPTKAVYMENSVFFPISVAANGLGFRVSWDETNSAFTLKPL
ncbi:copper amine oxidase N-terminal domain-containing protein [Neobacillus sp. SAB-20_R2A]|uniref:copper amine oxidase N-terminal domain-containing protein n=1 Tax=Neobacillus sp. SAB-20_R2A TaxID=3120519 RepID=UPI003C6DF1BE